MLEIEENSKGGIGVKKELSNYGKQCKVQMVVLGKNLVDIGNETGYSPNYISAIINSRVMVPLETLNKINAALAITDPADDFRSHII